MNEKKKHKIMLGIEVVLLCMIVAILGTNAASSNPPSNGVSYGKNNQTTVEGALNDLYTKANYGNASASQILKDKTALVGGKQVKGTMEDRGLAQYGNWGCGDAGCGSGNDAYYAINSLPEGYYHSDGNTWAPEARINANTLRTSLGITADKIVKGKSIAGVSGTGETSCPTCPDCPTCPTPESQGYYKIKTFSELTATCDRPGASSGCNTNWFTTSKETLSGCTSSNGCASANYFYTELTASLDFDYNEILGYNIVMTCPNDENCIRYSIAKSATGGADKTTDSRGLRTAGEISKPGISVSYGTKFSDRNASGFGIGNNCFAGIAGSIGNGKVKMKFDYDCWSNGTHYSPIELKGTSYKLSGYIIYR